ncbi:MAG: GNAT family N-acetyltransferase [Chloroflexota bacterium]|nr:GNAT family N-acetyltransferase [Chloroflexota bacterium]MDE2884219.1 GNAT family N-acetyltransferase [Chloroflexota bacterium]
MTVEVTFEAVTPDHPDAETLMALLDAELDEIYGDLLDGTTALSAEVRSSFDGTLDPDLKADFDGVFLVARRSGIPVACGGMLFLDEATGEVRRVYARPEERGRGVARELMAELERAASERGCSRILLETAIRQPRAMRFYEALGYTRVPPYGKHVGNPWSVCYEKRILPAGITFERTTPDDPEVAALLAAYEKEFLSLNTVEESGWTGGAVHQHLAAMLLVRRNGDPVGCGALRIHDAVTAELKRMYVVPGERGRGIATELVARLEQMAVERGASRMVLDTSYRMTSAVRLYERLGYVRTEPFPRHNSGAGMPALLYFEKRLR